jgi:hypothetical protein
VWIPRSITVTLGGQLPDPAAVRGLRTLGALGRVGFAPRVAFVRSTSNELSLVLRSGIEVRLGDLDRLGLKLAIATRLLPAVEAPEKGPAYLDLTVPERPVASAANPQVTGIG